MKQRLAVWAILTGLLMGATGYAAVDDDTVHFANPKRLARLMDNSPAVVVAALEALMTQEQADALEERLFPSSDAAVMAEAVEHAVALLREGGLEDTDSAIATLEGRLAELREEAP